MATQDDVDDDGESVKIGFGSLPGGVSAGSTDETTMFITDDDVLSVTASFEQATYTVAEGGSVTVKVTLDADPERTVTIPITKANQGGASNDPTTPACPLDTHLRQRCYESRDHLLRGLRQRERRR